MSKPLITIEFTSVHSSEATIKMVDVDYMQLFAAAKLLEMQGEGAYMQAQFANSQAAKGGLEVVRGVLPNKES